MISEDTDESKHDYNDENEGIEVYLRIRPSKKPSGYFSRDDFDEKRLTFNVPKRKGLIVNNSRTSYSFQFSNIIDEEATQEEVFRSVGASAVRNAIGGFNSTIFAYGQTGSGKTFTITGGPDRYIDRGIIPRAISMVFKEIASRPDINYTCYVSYLEIYNENGYDLLSEEHAASTTLEEMQRVHLMEDEGGNYHFKNLSIHPVSNEEDALNKLFIGDTNRAIGETEMNQASSRSHCIFTISLEARRVGSDSVIKSKLNLVDLAGSERVHKTNSSGQTLKEAKFINVSLFFLEMVIVALNEKAKNGPKIHVPYRNSMMTSVLRDSLGGNCVTKMIANISPEINQTDESISTCSFAQRVALVKNSAHINEEMEPELIIRRLKSELARLREEIKFLKRECGEEEHLSQDQRNALTCQVEKYVDDKNVLAKLNIGKISLTKIYDCFAIFKNIVLEARNQTSKDSRIVKNNTEHKSVEHHQESLGQRTRDIDIVVNVIKQKYGEDEATQILGMLSKDCDIYQCEPNKETLQHQSSNGKLLHQNDDKDLDGIWECKNLQMLENPQDAYAWFIQRHSSYKALQSNKSILKTKYLEAKDAAAQITKSKTSISEMIQKIEKGRKTRALNSIIRNEGDEKKIDNLSINSAEENLRNMIEIEKKNYKRNFSILKDLKAKIEYLHKILERGKVKLKNEFDRWYETMLEKKHKEKHHSKTNHATVNNDFNSMSPQLPPGIQLTGNEKTDDDIIAFYKAKEILLARRAANN